MWIQNVSCCLIATSCGGESSGGNINTFLRILQAVCLGATGIVRQGIEFGVTGIGASRWKISATSGYAYVIALDGTVAGSGIADDYRTLYKASSHCGITFCSVG